MAVAWSDLLEPRSMALKMLGGAARVCSLCTDWAAGLRGKATQAVDAAGVETPHVRASEVLRPRDSSSGPARAAVALRTRPKGRTPWAQVQPTGPAALQHANSNSMLIDLPSAGNPHLGCPSKVTGIRRNSSPLPKQPIPIIPSFRESVV